MSKPRTNEAWIEELRSPGDLQQAAIEDLRMILVRAAAYTFGRNLGDLEAFGPGQIEQLAEDCAQEALLAILNNLAKFRGESKFTTWAYKFAINIALMAARRERWKGASLDELSDSVEGDFSEWVMQDKSDEITPEQSALQNELRGIIRNVIEHDLTDKQRQVLLLMVFHEVPMDEVVRHFGANRNTVYKLLHDARRKLKSGLQARGFEVGETLALFGALR